MVAEKAGVAATVHLAEEEMAEKVEEMAEMAEEEMAGEVAEMAEMAEEETEREDLELLAAALEPSMAVAASTDTPDASERRYTSRKNLLLGAKRGTFFLPHRRLR